MKNARIRESLRKCGIHQWELARFMNIAESTLTRRLREELPEAEQDRIVALIESGGVSHERKQ